MMYSNLDLSPRRPGHANVYANFAQSIDGVIGVVDQNLRIGSDRDRMVMEELRAHADAIIHGPNTARHSGYGTRLATPEVVKMREGLGKLDPFIYVVVTRYPNEELQKNLESAEPHVIPLLASPAGSRRKSSLPRQAVIPAEAGIQNELSWIPGQARDDGEGKGGVSTSRQFEADGESNLAYNNLDDLLAQLHARGAQRILLECGPRLLKEFINAALLTDLFITIAPSISAGSPLNLRLDGVNSWQKLDLVAAQTVENEIYCHYRLRTEDS